MNNPGRQGHEQAWSALRVVIADDEAPARSRIRDLLEDCAASYALEWWVRRPTDARSIDCCSGCRPIWCFLTSACRRWTESSGQHIQKLPTAVVIFTTAYDAYALKLSSCTPSTTCEAHRLRRLFDALARARAMTPLSLDVLQEIAPKRAAISRCRSAGA